MLFRLSESEFREWITHLGEFCSGLQLSGWKIEPERFAQAGYSAWLFYFEKNHSSGHSRKFAGRFFAAAAEQMRQEAGLRELYAKFTAENIPFVPLKGADLAFHCYPEPALRPFSDWDIWIRPEDMERACQLLAADGWQCPLDTQGFHHRGMRIKGHFRLEPHFSLPNMGEFSASALWQYTVPVSGEKCERRLSGAMNLVMLFQHGLEMHCQYTNPVKLLLDMEFVLKNGKVDWREVDGICTRWHLAHPGLMLGAFPEFFRMRHDCGREFSAAECEALRILLLDTHSLVEQFGELKAMKQGMGPATGLRQLIRHCTPKNLRVKYPHAGDNFWQYGKYFFMDLRHKAAVFMRSHWQRNSSLSEQLVREKLVENSWKTK